MKRLVEELDISGADRGLAELVSHAEPYRSDPWRKRRVLVRVLRKDRPAPFFSLRSAVVALLFIGGTASAAVVGSRLIDDDVQEPIPPTPSASPAPSPMQPAPSRSRAEPKMKENVDEEAAEPVERSAPRHPPAAHESSRSTAKRAVRSESPEDPKRVINAIQALRRDKDPARAQALLESHLKQHPNGALAEEALALSIEAAVARKDPRAAVYAKRYLARYPNGRYRDFAARVSSKQ